VNSFPSGTDADNPGDRTSLDQVSRRRLWPSIIWTLLVVGLVGSAAGGFFWASYQQTEADRAFRNTGASLAASVNTSLRRDLDFAAITDAVVATSPGLTNADIAPLLQALDLAQRYPGTVGIGFVEQVSAANLPAFVATMQADPLVGTSPGSYFVYPAGSRAQYCLIRLGILTTNGPLPVGTDLCATFAPGALSFSTLFERATTTGQPAIVGLASAFSPSVLKTLKKMGVSPEAINVLRNLFCIFVPVYRGGTTPSTSAARDQASIGWIFGTFSAKSVLTPILANVRSVKLQLRSGTGAAAGVVASGGSEQAGAHLSFTRTISANPPMSVVVTGPASSNGIVQGVALGAIGAALVIFLFLFLLHMARSREQAMRLVDERTRQLRHQALHDPLTGLPNRSLLFDRAKQMLLLSQRKRLEIGALYVDLDNFKDVNDSFGHQFGDKVLRAVADRFASVLRSGDTVGRLGGDEFLVLVEGEGLESSPELVAERLRAVLTEPLEFDGLQPVSLSIRTSIGVAIGLREDPEKLFRDADAALYQAKAAGKDRSVVFRPEMQKTAHE